MSLHIIGYLIGALVLIAVVSVLIGWASSRRGR